MKTRHDFPWRGATLLVLLSTLLAVPAAADQCFNDDLIVDGSTCIGLDCVCNSETFGFDTLRLKENNLRIKFEDTSVLSSYPTRDWEIRANDSANGGRNRLSIVDVDAGTIPFTVEGPANGSAGSGTNNSLWIDSSSKSGGQGGRIGFGTSSPVVDLHDVSGDTPTLRLEQNNSAGFTPQTWDIAGNETNFFVRDVTNGSKLPFRIRPDADSNSLYIDSDEQIGMGTSAPGASLHVRRSDGSARIEVTETQANANQTLLKLDHNGTPQFVLENDAVARTWLFANDGGFFMNNTGNAGIEMRLSAIGDLTILGGLITTGGGGACTVADPCDGVFNPDFEVESIDEHADYMWRNRHLRGVGPTLENGPINLTKKTGGLINELEKAHIYIEQLHRDLRAKDAQLSDLELRLTLLEAVVMVEKEPLE